MILEILNLEDPSSVTSSFKKHMINDPLQFVKREKYTEDTVDMITEFFVSFIQDVLGEQSQNSYF